MIINNVIYKVLLIFLFFPLLHSFNFTTMFFAKEAWYWKVPCTNELNKYTDIDLFLYGTFDEQIIKAQKLCEYFYHEDHQDHQDYQDHQDHQDYQDQQDHQDYQDHQDHQDHKDYQGSKPWFGYKESVITICF